MAAAPQLENAQYRLAQYYLRRLRNAQTTFLHGHEHSTDALQLFDQEWSQIRRWRDWSAAHANEDAEIAELCKEFPQAGIELFALRQHPNERLQWLQTGLDAARLLQDARAEMVHLYLLSRTHSYLGSSTRALDIVGQALALAQHLEDNLYVCKCFCLLGSIYYSLDEYEQSRAAHEQALALSRQLDVKSEMGKAINGLGNVALSQSDNQLAYRYYLQFLEISEAHGQPQDICVALHNLSLVALRLHNDLAAVEYGERSVALCRVIGFQHFLSESVALLGDVKYARGDLAEARAHFEESLDIARQISNHSGEASAHNNLGSLLCRLGDYQAALEHLEAALTLAQKIEERWFAAIALMYFVRVFRLTGTLDYARRKLYEGLQVAATLQSSAIRAKYLLEAALLWADRGELTQPAVWLGLLQGHPTKLDAEQRRLRDALYRRLEESMAAEDLAACIQRGTALELNSEIDRLLSQCAVKHGD